jgi:hypothetical protein
VQFDTRDLAIQWQATESTVNKSGTQVIHKNPAGRLQLKRSDLLPMTAPRFRSLSLRNHLALVGLRRGYGHAELAGELLRTAYLSYFIAGVDVDEGTLETCVAAELTIKASVAHAKMAGEWALTPAHAHYVEKMLCLHDTQLSTLPLCVIDAAARRLSQMIEEGGMPNLASKYLRVVKRRSEPAHPVACTSGPGMEERQEDSAALALA